MLFVCEIVKNNLMDRGLISYLGKSTNHDETTETTVMQHNRPDLIDVAKIIDKITPLQLDVELTTNNPVNEIIIEHHASTFLSVTTETHWRKGALFYSEKTWKPILAGQPFMMICSTGMLGELKRQGYKTFSNWWSEEYDNEPNIDKRVKMVVDELVKLSKLSVDELIELRKQMIPVLEHNQKLFEETRTKKYKGSHEEYLYAEIKKIWETF